MINFYGYYEALYDQETRLMCHIWDDENRTYAKAAHWESGNGRAFSSIARMIGLLPEQYEKDVERIWLKVF